ncbi:MULTISPECIES: preprotein translocase subunit YajC [Clostridium]|uniref:preprotein translocase subunit YajC n=1 Tax=Clostridium TaxID=1485 RepID=UPI00069ECA0E|nr:MULTISPECIES: preprotein translocase subunit YajC [Clostridium]KOF55933.1 preprotein translocase subunit YajC [Clostridium sp. DMHC 10]MCD2345325.1 preprotein translocase subunit YajC [Clostridium guangxiense]
MSATAMTIIYFVVILGIFYLALWVPESRRKKKFKQMMDSLRINDEVVTRGGILGKIVNIQDNYLVIQSGPDKTRLKVQKSAIGNVLTKKAEETK